MADRPYFGPVLAILLGVLLMADGPYFGTHFETFKCYLGGLKV